MTSNNRLSNNHNAEDDDIDNNDYYHTLLAEMVGEKGPLSNDPKKMKIIRSTARILRGEE